MVNEIAEFEAYTKTPFYAATGKRDTSYLGRFTFATFTNFEGLGRILTVLARGYLLADSSQSPYECIDYARRALCAWCSIPEKEKKTPTKKSEPKVNFGYLYSEFPELVNANGEGWFYRHAKNIVRFVKKNPALVSSSAVKNCEALSKGFTREWKKKVKQLQVPIFAVNTKGAWILRFDDILAEALEQGALCNPTITFTAEEKELFKKITPKGVPENVIPTVIAYIRANRQPDTDWVVLPVSSFDCYFGNRNFSKKWLNMIPDSVIERQRQSFGVCRVREKRHKT